MVNFVGGWYWVEVLVGLIVGFENYNVYVLMGVGLC